MVVVVVETMMIWGLSEGRYIRPDAGLEMKRVRCSGWLLNS
jgi:hypothetical protein